MINEIKLTPETLALLSQPMTPARIKRLRRQRALKRLCIVALTVALAACAIYDIRPQVCRDFGKGGHPLLQCPNDPRTDTRAIDKKINEVLNKIKGEI